MAYDLVIRGGTVVDGTGAPGFRADVGVVGDRIVAVGTVDGHGATEVDADGLVVTPGFIDGHTHMDAQVNWDPLGTCSCWHGVTTVVMGNCGFTLAPARPDGRHLVVRNLERAEDISADAMAAGIEWKWETFPEYLDTVDALPKGINYAGYIGHSALRTWAMGERAFEEEATEEDLRMMERQVADAMAAGAIGFTTSRSTDHQTADDRPVASRLASWEEVQRLVGVVGRSGKGVFELALDRRCWSTDPDERTTELNRLRDLALDTGVPVSFGVVSVTWRDNGPLLRMVEETNAAGGTMFGQSHCREFLLFSSFRTKLGFDVLPEWQEVRSRPLDEQRRLLTDPDVRRRLVHAAHHGSYRPTVGPEAPKPDFERTRVLDRPLPPNPTVAELATQRGVDPVEVMIDLGLESDFHQLFAQVVEQDTDEVLTLLRHPNTVMTFTDSGAHVSQILDASLPTHLLGYWVREREAFTLEEGVRMLTSVPAAAWRFTGRGAVAEGMIADLNVFDPNTIAPGLPVVEADLPGGAKRLKQKAAGIKATVVAGQVVLRDTEPTGALPGRLLRAENAMQFWQSVHGVESDQVIQVAQLADELGYAGITFGDHLVKPVDYEMTYLYSESGRPPWDPEALGPTWTPPYADPWILAAVLAQSTSRVRFMPYVYVLPLRHPVHVAKQVATAAFFSQNRVVLGVGTGWLEEEFHVVDQQWKERGARTDEMLEVVASLVSGHDTEHHGRFYDIPPVRMAPVPSEPVPVMVGGHSDAALRRAARHDGWLGVDYELDDLAPLIAKLNRYREELGTDGRPFDIFVVLKSGLDQSSLHALEDLGVTMTQDYAWLYKGEPRTPFERKRETMLQFAERWMG